MENKKYAIFAIAMLLVVGLGSFQYWAMGTQSTATATIGSVDTIEVTVTTGSPDIVTHPIITGKPGPVGNSSAYLYKVAPDTTYNENYTATVYLTNTDDLGQDYTYLNMNVTLQNGSSVINSKWLMLETGRIQFKIDNVNFSSSFPAYINITDGNYYIPSGETATADPSFVIDVEALDITQW